MNSDQRNSSIGRYQELILIVAIVLVAMDLRPGIVAIGPVLPTIIDDFGLSHAVASLMTSIPDLLMGALALPTPWLVRRFGLNAVLQTALFVLCVSMILRSYAPTTGFLLGTTVGVGAGIAVAGALFAGIVKTRFADRVALMMGIYATAISLGSALSAGMTGWLSQFFESGWRGATGVWSVFGFLAMASWWVVMRSEKSTAKVQLTKGGDTKLPFANGTAWLVAAYFACVNFLFYSILTWTAPMYQEHGYSASETGLILACFTIVFMFASPVVGALSKSIDRRNWLAGSAILPMIGLAGIVATPGHYPFFWLSVVALGLGSAFTLAMTLPLDNTHSADEANRWNAFVLTIGYLVAASGPLLLGAIRDIVGNFQAPFSILVVVAVLMLITVPFLKPRQVPG